MQFVVVLLDGQRYALPLRAVNRIVGAVEVAPLPGAPTMVLGAIDMEGIVLPVFCMRRRLGLAHVEVTPHHQFLIARTPSRWVALMIDAAHGVIDCGPSDIIGMDEAVPGLEQFRGLARLDDGLVLIHDLENFLSLEEARCLDDALEHRG